MSQLRTQRSVTGSEWGGFVGLLRRMTWRWCTPCGSNVCGLINKQIIVCLIHSCELGIFTTQNHGLVQSWIQLQSQQKRCYHHRDDHWTGDPRTFDRGRKLVSAHVWTQPPTHSFSSPPGRLPWPKIRHECIEPISQYLGSTPLAPFWPTLFSPFRPIYPCGICGELYLSSHIYHRLRRLLGHFEITSTSTSKCPLIIIIRP